MPRQVKFCTAERQMQLLYRCAFSDKERFHRRFDELGNDIDKHKKNHSAANA
jgi:hypothetical protein